MEISGTTLGVLFCSLVAFLLGRLIHNFDQADEALSREVDALWARNHEISEALQAILVTVERIQAKMDLLDRTGQTHLTGPSGTKL